MAVWDVSRLPERDQFDYWHEVICQAFVPLTPSRKERGDGFASTVETRSLARINRARIRSQAQATRHGPREVAATDSAFYFVNLQLEGRCHTRQGAADSVVRPGQFVLVDTTEPYYFDFDGSWRMLSYRVPHHCLRSRLSGAALKTGVPVDGRGAGGAVTALMEALWHVDDTVAAGVRHELEQAFAATVVAATGGTPQRDGRAALRTAIGGHIRARLSDRTLSVSSVCRRFAISPRTLHKLFAETGESFAATVRGLRLDRCAAVLGDPSVTATIAEIAVAHGFDDPTTFSRAFRRRFGFSPREARTS